MSFLLRPARPFAKCSMVCLLTLVLAACGGDPADPADGTDPTSGVNSTDGRDAGGGGDAGDEGDAGEVRDTSDGTDSTLAPDTGEELDANDPSSALAAPAGLAARVADSEVTLYWDEVTGATGYNVYLASERGVNPESYANLDQGRRIADATSPAVIAELENGTTYFFVVTAFNDELESQPSPEFSATPYVPVWSQLQGLEEVPSRRWGHAMVYDSARDRIVLFGGREGQAGGTQGETFADTWVWDGAGWEFLDLPEGERPPGRYEHNMVYDKARDRIVLFGGHDGDISILQDTWEFDGTSWTEIDFFQRRQPPKRKRFGMAYHEELGAAVLFGGWSGTEGLRDTWIWDGTDWTNPSITTRPVALRGHTMVYDQARQEVILFGGLHRDPNFGNFEMNETWRFDGESWEKFSFPAGEGPRPRTGHAMVYDVGRQRIVLQGGRGNGQYQVDTWEWDGTDWTRFDDPTSGAPHPDGRSNHAMAYRNGEIILLGGIQSGSTLATLWRWGWE